jgi:hypothetical protein
MDDPGFEADDLSKGYTTLLFTIDVSIAVEADAYDTRSQQQRHDAVVEYLEQSYLELGVQHETEDGSVTFEFDDINITRQEG